MIVPQVLLLLTAFMRVSGTSFPIQEYHYLQELYESTKGWNWLNHTNWNFENISLYNPCLQSWYGLYAYCEESKIGLQGIYLGLNNLSGKLPPVLANFTYLRSFYFFGNHLTGGFPSFINCPERFYIDISNNSLTGSFPSNAFQNSPQIASITVTDNYLNGTLPEDIYDLPVLTDLYLDQNLFSGTISESLSKLVSLQYLYLSSNRFHGSFPTNALMNMTALHLLMLEFNDFSGSILFSLTTQPNLADIYLSNNHFEGSFPNVPMAPKLSGLIIGGNAFTGTIPSWFCDIPGFQQLNISYNQFRGSLPSCWNNFTAMDLFSIGYNFITGTIPIQVFSFPEMQLLTIAENCFDDSRIDDSICDNLSQKIELVNMNSLHSTKCESKRTVVRRYEGSTVPRCLWELPEVAGLFFSANAFSGSIPSDIQINIDSVYGYWNITHNRISGSLSPIFENAIAVNMLEGNLFACSSRFGSGKLPQNDPNYSNYFCGSSQLDYASYLLTSSSGLLLLLIISFTIVFFRKSLASLAKQPLLLYEKLLLWYSHHISLLSIFPESFDTRKERFDKVYHYCLTLNVFIRIAVIIFSLTFIVLLPTYLIFYLSRDHSTYKYDFEYNWVQSSAYLTGNTVAAVLFVLWIGMIVVFLVVLMKSHNMSRQETLFRTVLAKTVKWYEDLNTKGEKGQDLRLSLLGQEQLESTENFENDVLLNQLHVKGRDQNNQSISISNDNRFLSMAAERSDQENEEKDQIRQFEYYSTYLTLLSINVVATFALNYFYLSLLSASSTTFEIKVSVQMGLAMVKLFWNYCIVSIMIAWLKRWEEYQSETYRLRLFLLVWNTIIAPCTAALFTDRLCFYEYFFGASKLSTILNGAYNVDNTTLIYYFRENNIGLPFMYYYTCSSRILTSYIPVFLYTYAILPFISISLIVVLSHVKVEGRGKAWNQFIQAMVPGILRPKDYQKFRKFIFAEGIMSTLVLHVNVLMTFGMQSPLLSFAIAVTICVESLLWKAMIVRFVKYESKDVLKEIHEKDENEIVKELRVFAEEEIDSGTVREAEEMRMAVVNKALQDEWFYLYKARWRIFYVAMLFIVLIVLDFSGDELGLSSSLLWVGISSILVMIGIRLFLTDIVKRWVVSQFFKTFAIPEFRHCDTVTEEIERKTVFRSAYIQGIKSLIGHYVPSSYMLPDQFAQFDSIRVCKRSDEPGSRVISKLSIRGTWLYQPKVPVDLVIVDEEGNVDQSQFQLHPSPKGVYIEGICVMHLDGNHHIRVFEVVKDKLIE
eukprot:gene11046-12038_t